MQLSEITERAAKRATALPPPADLDGERDRLRAALATFLEQAPEPPVYRRRDDPLKQQVAHQLREGEELLARVLALGDERLVAWREALEAYLQSQCLVADGKLEQAEDAWLRAQELERVAARERRVWSRSDEAPLPVYQRESGASRFDPRPEPSLQGKLLCPSCRVVADFPLSLRHASHQFVCGSCGEPFTAYVGELRSLEQKDVSKSRRHYVMRLEELRGTRTRLDFEDGSGGAFTGAHRDLIAFLYAPRRVLRGVLNLSSGRALWLRSAGPCFLASAVYPEGADELRVFRAFRDQTLLPSRPGRLAVRGYYAIGPSLARVVRGSPALRRLTRAALGRIHRQLRKGGL